MLGIDKDGKPVIVELKKGRTPREVVAQILDYAAWLSELSDDALENLALQYFSRHGSLSDKEFTEVFCLTFETDERPLLNRHLRLFIAAEEITPGIARVCRFLRRVHHLDIYCVEFTIYQTDSGEILVSSELVVGQEGVDGAENTLSVRWSGDKPVKQVVWEAVQEFIQGDWQREFSAKEIIQLVHSRYPSFNKTTVRCQIISDCVNHSSRHHYPGGEDRYWRIEKGKYRRYLPEQDLPVQPLSAG